jgi:hypothetical protein
MIMIGAIRPSNRGRSRREIVAGRGAGPRGTVGTKEIRRALSPVLPRLYLECESLTGPRSLTISRKGGDVDEHFGSTLRRGDEAEASIVIPFGERALSAHHLHRRLDRHGYLPDAQAAGPKAAKHLRFASALQVVGADRAQHAAEHEVRSVARVRADHPDGVLIVPSQ